MPDTDDIYLIQAAVSEELAKALKGHAGHTGVFLGDVYIEALEQFIEHWHLAHKKGQFVPYLSHPRHARPLNMKIPKKLAARVQALAAKDDVAVRRFAYTALIHYAVNLKLIPAATTVQSGVPADHEEPSVSQMLREFRKKSGHRKG